MSSSSSLSHTRGTAPATTSISSPVYPCVFTTRIRHPSCGVRTMVSTLGATRLASWVHSPVAGSRNSTSKDAPGDRMEMWHSPLAETTNSRDMETPSGMVSTSVS
jgi:hypothetical protein